MMSDNNLDQWYKFLSTLNYVDKAAATAKMVYELIAASSNDCFVSALTDVQRVFSKQTSEWKLTSVELPYHGQKVETKVEHSDGIPQFVRILRRYSNIWYEPNSYVYVCYTPTHWRAIDNQE